MADVTKNTDKNRYEISVDGELAGYADYVVGEHGVIVLPHTKVEERFSGQGLAGELVRYALDDIRSEGYRVDPQCTYVQGWIGKNPEYADLVAHKDGVDADEAADGMEEVTGVDPTSDPRI
ncbi:MAG: GNAT family N-acetyltransferase [Propionibacteriaceae bacterium]|nr:GNAT family N-acetyltransferase [Propionibacteriaceae bacterium]